jgi:predicted Zn-dependent protease
MQIDGQERADALAAPFRRAGLDVFVEDGHRLGFRSGPGDERRIRSEHVRGAAVRRGGVEVAAAEEALPAAAGGITAIMDLLDEGPPAFVRLDGVRPVGTDAVRAARPTSDLAELRALLEAAVRAERAEPVKVTAVRVDRRVWVSSGPGPLSGRVERSRRVTVRAPAPNGVVVTGSAWDFGDVQPWDDLLRHGLESVRRGAVRAGSARPVPPGTYDVMFAPSASTVVVHELCGHLLESDNFGRAAVAASVRVGDMVSSEAVDVVDEGTAADPWVAAEHDDHGHATARRTLISNGRLQSLLGAAPGDGSMRRAGYAHPALVRLRCIALSGRAAEDPPSPRRRLLTVDNLLSGVLLPKSGLCVLRLGTATLDGAGSTAVAGGVIRCDAVTFLRNIVWVGGAGDAVTERAVCTKRDQRLPTVAISPALFVRQVEVRPS